MNKFISKSVWLPLLTSLFMLPLWMGCSGVDDALEHEKACVVGFTLHAIETRTTTSLPAGSTLRVIAYLHTDGQTDYPEANRRDECTYKVELDGTLSICAVNADGTVDATGVPQTDMALAPGTYDFYAITPALRVYHEEANPMAPVKHEVDFAVSITPQIEVAMGINRVALAPMNRKCTRLKFNTDRHPTLSDIIKIRVQSLTLENMSDEPVWATGTDDLTLANNAYATAITIPGSAFSVPDGTPDNCRQTAEMNCLPRPESKFLLRATVLYNDDTTPTVLETTVSATAFAPGSSHTLNIYLGYEKIKVEVTDEWTDLTNTDRFGIIDLNKEANNQTANCYLITDNAIRDYVFNATVRGNNATAVGGINYSTLPELAEARKARVIWQTGTNASTLMIDPTSLQLKNGKVFFTTSGKVNEGNAVIGIFASSAANAECLWSWHIWKVDGPLPVDVYCTKTPSPNTALPNFNMMALNLGAYNNTQGNPGSIGLLYQWGRKDPFPGPAGFNTTEPSNIYGSWNNGGTTGLWNGDYSIKTSITNGTIGTEAWAVKYPTAYILQPKTPFNWMSVSNDNLWGTPWISENCVGGYNGNQGVKSIYDPCPVGYRVPPQDTWSKQTGNGSFSNNGIILGSFHTSLWFPAAGLRNGTSVGELESATSYGCYWSSSIYSAGSTYGGHLYFVSDGRAWPQSNGGCQVNGFSVRCVSE